MSGSVPLMVSSVHQSQRCRLFTGRRVAAAAVAALVLVPSMASLYTRCRPCVWKGRCVCRAYVRVVLAWIDANAH